MSALGLHWAVIGPAIGADSSSLAQASTFASGIDRSFQLVAWFAVFVTVVVAGGLLLLAIARRDASTAGQDAASGASTASRVVRWTMIASLALAGVFFVQGTLVWADLQVVPRGAFPVRVAVGEKGFTFTYPNGHVADELHVPVDRPVKLLFRGDRRPYTFAVPEFRLQVPVAMSQDHVAWVQPTLAGEYVARSNTRPTASTLDLQATVVVHADAGFDKWYEDVSGPSLSLPPIELGRASYQMRGCTQCHTIDGSKLVGPSFKGFLARQRRLKDGTPVVADDAYIVESIVDSQAKVLEGYEPVMPSFKGRLRDQEVAGLVAFIKSLQ